MSEIWYLLKCPEGAEADYIEKYQELAGESGLQEIVSFQYQRMLRYGGSWHLERRTLLPGHIFLSGAEKMIVGRWGRKGKKREKDMLLLPCKVPFLKMLCSEDGLIDISRGIIRNGVPVVTEGPLKGREQLIRKIDRHKRTAEILVPLDSKTVEVTVGLEIYQKEM